MAATSAASWSWFPSGVVIRLRTVGIVGIVACVLATLATTLPSLASEPTGSSTTEQVLRVGLSRWSHDGAGDVALDPQLNYWAGGWAIMQCCLIRTLMAYPDVPAPEGGTALQPDIAADFPTISLDGLTWTFHLRERLHYAPPLQDTEITAGDIVRALERLVAVDGAQQSYYSVIEGFDAARLRNRGPISGLETPDPHTLVVHLTQPVADLGERLSLPATSPIAPYKDRALGVAQGYDDFTYGAYAVSSGPYMFASSPELDFAKPGDESHPLYRPEDTSWVWIRNPSWDPATDPIRAAVADRIEFRVTTGATTSSDEIDLHTDEVTQWVRDGLVDVAWSQLGHGFTPEGRVAWARDPQWSGAIVPSQSMSELLLGLRVAVAPLDDVHVRRAVAYAMDRRAYLAGQNEEQISQTHLILDQFTENILAAYDPYPGGDIAAAKREMAKSAYDADHDGRCDADACRQVVFQCDCSSSQRALMAPLRALGMHVELHASEYGYVPAEDTSIGMFTTGWGYDWVDAYSVFDQLLGHGDWTQVGAQPGELRSLGYNRTRVPSLAGPIAYCEALAGPPRTWCWARLDQREMEDTVALLPLSRLVLYWPRGPRVVQFGVTAWGQPALDRMVVADGS